MALIMLAIGGLLTLVGVYAIATGLPVIEIERGWSMVISGAVLLSGGLIVAGLGIVVRTLNGLKAGLTGPAPAAFPHQEPAVAPSAFTVQPPAPPPPAAEGVPAFAVAAPAAAAALAAGVGQAALLRDADAREASPAHPPEPEVADHATHDAFDPPADQAEPAHVPAERTTAGVADPLGHDWLEKDFAAFDLDAPHQTAPHEAAMPPHAAPPAYEPAPPAQKPEVAPPESPAEEPLPAAADSSEEPLHPEPVPAPAQHAMPDPAADAPATAPEAPSGNLTVIGRYDSDGTSYVMYSDGSIEAQSESGVFRFGSMAELKAFIEG